MTDEAQGTQGAPEDTPAETPAATEQQAPQRPDHVPEKFWDAEKGTVNTEALLQSYTELEKARSKPADEAPQDDSQEPPADDQQDPPQDENAPSPYEAAVAKATEELQSETGQISDETYEAFAKQGIPRDVVDAHVANQQAAFELRQIYAEREAGGNDAYAAMLQWAGANYSPEDAEAYNQAVFGPDKDAAMQAVRSLKAKYEEHMGSEGKIVTTGTGTAAPGGYADKGEWLADLRKPEYKKDPKFREAVRKKLETSMKNGVDLGISANIR